MLTYKNYDSKACVRDGNSDVAYWMNKTLTVTTSSLWESYSVHSKSNNSAYLLALLELMVSF